VRGRRGVGAVKSNMGVADRFTRKRSSIRGSLKKKNREGVGKFLVGGGAKIEKEGALGEAVRKGGEGAQGFMRVWWRSSRSGGPKMGRGEVGVGTGSRGL